MLSEIEIIYTGIVMGVVRVLACPDHLSALATLVGMNVSSSSSRHREGLGNFILGINWGIGMSLGLSVVCGVLFVSSAGGSADNGWYELWSVVSEGVVGVFMIALGSNGLRVAYLNRKEFVDVAQPDESPDEAESVNLKDDDVEDNDSISDRRDSVIVRMMESVLTDDSFRTSISSSIKRPSEHSDDGGGCDWGRVEDICDSSLTGALTAEVDRYRKPLARAAASGLSVSFVRYQENRPTLKKATSFLRLHTPAVASVVATGFPNNCVCSVRCCFSCSAENLLAVAAGIVHGVAGPGGVLGVVPVVQLQDAKMEVIYLSMFCLTSTLVMGSFALFYGVFSRWLAGGRIQGSDDGSRVFWVEAGSAGLSIVVGLVWLVVLSIGKLNEVFYR